MYVCSSISDKCMYRSGYHRYECVRLCVGVLGYLCVGVRVLIKWCALHVYVVDADMSQVPLSLVTYRNRL